MVSSTCGGNQVRSTKTSVSCLQSSMLVEVSWSGAAWVLLALGSYSSLREPWMPTCTVTYWSRAWSPPFGDWAAGQFSNMITTNALLKKLRVKVMDWPSQLFTFILMPPDLNPIEHKGASSNERLRSARSLTSTSSVMSSGGLLWQPVKLWWTPCPRGLRQCWKIMVATHNIVTLGPIWAFSLRGVLPFVASGLDINGCVLNYFERTALLCCYTICTLTTLHCSKVSFLQCCHMKIYNKIFTKMWVVYSLLWDTVYVL